jgi:type I restriction enzyme S subunit
MHIKAWRILLPPIAEQQRIVDCIDAERSPINSAIARLEREIDLLREYRTRLIADVVTGKLDVREAVARLPIEAPPDIENNDAVLVDESEAADEETAT